VAPVETYRDPGLQPERTRLAWRRTTLTCAVTALLAVRHTLRSDRGGVEAVGVGLEALGFLVFLWASHRRIQRLGAARPPVLSARAAVALAGCTTALAVLGAALVY
jgi:hypothetical protein